MKILGYVFLAAFAVALGLGIYSISKILGFAKIRKNVSSEKIWATLAQKRQVQLDRILVKKNHRKFSRVEQEKILKNISTCRKCILIGLIALIIAIVFIVIG